MTPVAASRPRLQEVYVKQIAPALLESGPYNNVMAVPTVVKVVLNAGIGDAIREQRILDSMRQDMAVITGQQAAVTKAKRSIAGFKLREGQAIGLKVTLRGRRMWEFLDRTLSLALPRIRDFRGLAPTAFDGRGNYTFGVTEQLIFPEIDYDKVVQTRGMDISIVTSAKTDEEGRALLAALGFPFKGAPVAAAAAS